MSLAGSATASPAAGSISVPSSMRRAAARLRRMSRTSTAIVSRCTGSGRKSILPASICDRSNTSLISVSRWRELVRMSPRYSWWAGAIEPTLPSCISWAKPMTALSGVRSSCDMLARNSLFSRLASCRLLRRSSSECRRSVMSRMALDTSSPSSVSRGARLISTGNSLPSLRRPYSSLPEPMPRTRGSPKKCSRCRGWRARKRSGTSISTGWPSSSWRV